MTQYLVQWEMDIEADTPEEAASEALKVHRDPSSEATYFTVTQLAAQKMYHVDIQDGQTTTTVVGE